MREFDSHPRLHIMKIKILYRKNLKMSPGKLAAQAVHAALGLAEIHEEAADPMMSVVVLGVSDTKFDEAQIEHLGYVVEDAGFTEVAPGTETCFAFIELIKFGSEDESGARLASKSSAGGSIPPIPAILDVDKG